MCQARVLELFELILFECKISTYWYTYVQDPKYLVHI